MNTKEWLYCVENLNKKINRAQQLAEETYYGCINTTPNYSKDVVSGTRDPHSKYDKYIEARDKVNCLIDELISTKHNMREVIAKIPDERCRALLVSRFVELDRWNVVAAKCGCSISHAKHDLLKKATQYLVFELDCTHNIW